MAKSAPDGILLEVLGKGEEGEEGEEPQSPEEHGRKGGPGGTHRRSGSIEHGLDSARPPNVLDQLVAVLHDAGLETHPRHQKGKRHTGTGDSNSDDEENIPKFKILILW